jgi:hypothetical protein
MHMWMVDSYIYTVSTREDRGFICFGFERVLENMPVCVCICGWISYIHTRSIYSCPFVYIYIYIYMFIYIHCHMDQTLPEDAFIYV